MKTLTLLLGFALAPLWALQSTMSSPAAKVQAFPNPDFTLGEKVKPEKSRVALGPMQSDGKGGTKGTFAVYGGSSLISVSSLSFSGDGKLLAVGSMAGRVDLWDVENKKRLRTIDAGSTVALSFDGRLLATDVNGIELYDVQSAKLVQRIPRALKSPDNVIVKFEFNPVTTLLDVTANGDDDVVYEISSGKLLLTLTNTRQARFSSDGALLIGGNYQHLIVWNTKDWSKVSDVPNGPEYIRRVAVFPEKDLAVLGGPKAVRLVRISSGQELAKVGEGWSNFAAFDQEGSLVFTYAGGVFSVWDTKGAKYCTRAALGNGTLALSPDDRWLASAPLDGSLEVSVWNLPNALKTCGAPVSATDH
jgi:WD40 repeat protein